MTIGEETLREGKQIEKRKEKLPYRHLGVFP